MRTKRSTLIGIAVLSAAAAAIGFMMQPFVTRHDLQPPAVDPGRLEAHVKYLSVNLFPRSFEKVRNTQRAAEYIRGQFLASGAALSVQDVHVQEATYQNIIARFGPASGPLLVIGAHYDSYGDPGEGAKYPLGHDRTTHTPGADDNASGVAGLLELARLLREHPPGRTVLLVAYAVEEPPHFMTEHMGSFWHARALMEEGRKVDLMLSLEMIGFFSDEESSQSFPLPGMNLLYPDRGNFIALVGRLGDYRLTRRAKSIMQGATDLPVFSINAPRIVPGIDFSDHRSYWRVGYPALMVTDTGFYRNPNYHRAGDTYDTLDYRRMAKVVQAVYAVAQVF